MSDIEDFDFDLINQQIDFDKNRHNMYSDWNSIDSRRAKRAGNLRINNADYEYAVAFNRFVDAMAMKTGEPVPLEISRQLDDARHNLFRAYLDCARTRILRYGPLSAELLRREEEGENLKLYEVGTTVVSVFGPAPWR